MGLSSGWEGTWPRSLMEVRKEEGKFEQNSDDLSWSSGQIGRNDR